jgi:hypothetical protein
VILIDTSAWIEFPRDTGSPTCEAVDLLLADDLAVCDPVAMEVLAGARDEHHPAQLRGLLARATVLPTTPADYDAAAALYRTCYARGEPVRRLIDCLIAAVAIRAGAEVVHADDDFTGIARHTDLQVDPASMP